MAKSSTPKKDKSKKAKAAKPKKVKSDKSKKVKKSASGKPKKQKGASSTHTVVPGHVYKCVKTSTGVTLKAV
jgi:hypothetical protein